MNVTKLKYALFFSEFSCITPVVTLYLLGAGISLGQIILAQALYSVGALVAEIPTGVFADLYGHIVAFISLVALLFLPGASTLYLINLMQGVSAGFLSGSVEALLFEELKQKRESEKYSKTYSALLSYGALSFILAALTSSLLVALFGAHSYRLLILIMIVGQGISVTLSLLLQEHHRKVSLPDEIRSRTEKALTLFSGGVATILQNVILFYIGVALLLTNCGEYFLKDMFQPLLSKAGVPEYSFGLLLCAGSLLHFFIVRNIHYVERHIHLPHLLLILYSTISAGYLVLSTATDPLVLIGVVILIFGLINAERPAISDYVNEQLYDDGIRATVLSMLSLASSISTIIMRGGLSFMLDGFGLRASFFFQGAVLLAGISTAYFMMQRCRCVKRRVDNPSGAVPMSNL